MPDIFQTSVEAALAKLPYPTPAGRVSPTLTPIHLGFPGGSHEVASAWIYQRAATNLEMVFRFYTNFTPHDLICKVVAAGKYPQSGEGASVQFNAARCVQARGSARQLVHSGETTVKTRLARPRLVETLERVCPREMDLAGIKNGSSKSWPVTIGSTNDIPALLDRVFVFAFCIEQAKRHLRSEPALPSML